jgi:hypothetical protein
MLQNRPNAPAGSPNPPLSPNREAYSPSSLPPYYPAPPNRLQQALKTGFLVLIAYAVFIILELALPKGLKPSSFIGGFEGDKRAAFLEQELEMERKKAAALNHENMVMQTQIEEFKANLDRVTKTLEADLQLRNTLAQANANMQQEYAKARQQLVQQGQSGKVAVAGMADMFRVLGELFGAKQVASSAGQVANQYRHEALNEVDTEAQRTMGGVSFANAAQSAPSPARGPAAVARLARVNGKHPKVLVRAQPKGGAEREKKLCVLAQGAVVAVLDDGGGSRITDPDSGITFVHVRFNREGYGDTRGWIGEKLLDEFSGPGQTAQAVQVCEELTDEETT